MVLTIVALCVSTLGFETRPVLTEVRVCASVYHGAPQLVAQDISKLQAQAQAGDATAQLKLAQAYRDGDGVAKDEHAAFSWYRKAAEQGNSEAQNFVDEIYRFGQGVDQNKEEAVRWWHMSARQCNASAMWSLGAAYYNGDGVDIDDGLSYAWFLLAKKAGSERAIEAVQRAESTLRNSDIAAGLRQIGEMYERGDYLPRNQTEATHWLLEAAKKGDADAQSEIAVKLVTGLGIAQDLGQAQYWCNQLEKKQDIRTGYCMGYLYQNGLKDAGKARKRFGHASDSGYGPAITALAQMEVTGEGGKIDRVAACVLYARLAIAKDVDSPRSLANLKSEMSDKEWKKVEKQLLSIHIDTEKLDALLLKVSPQ